MKKIVFVIISLILISCKQESIKQHQELKKDLVNEKLSYEVINHILESIPKDERSVSNFLAYDNEQISEQEIKSNDYLGISKMDTLFSKLDVKYIIEQNNERRNFSLNQNFIKSKTIIPNKKLKEFSEQTPNGNNFWGNYSKVYGKTGYYVVSKPLFSLNKEIVIISIGHRCGELCGGGSTIILKKINGKWKFIGELLNWQS